MNSQQARTLLWILWHQHRQVWTRLPSLQAQGSTRPGLSSIPLILYFKVNRWGIQILWQNLEHFSENSFRRTIYHLKRVRKLTRLLNSGASGPSPLLPLRLGHLQEGTEPTASPGHPLESQQLHRSDFQLPVPASLALGPLGPYGAAPKAYGSTKFPRDSRQQGLVRAPRYLTCAPWAVTDTRLLCWLSELPFHTPLQQKTAWNPCPFPAFSLPLTSSIPYWCVLRLPHK